MVFMNRRLQTSGALNEIRVSWETNGPAVVIEL